MRALFKRALGLERNEPVRQAWVRAELESLPSGARLLDAGAGEQQYRKFCQHLRYVSQDFGQYNGIGNQSGLQAGSWSYGGLDIVSDIGEIPEPDGSFDAILCTEVLEHVPNPLKALQEFHRLLRPGGSLILTAPFASLVHFAPYHFASGFSKYWYQHHLQQNGFELIRIDPNGDWYDFLSQEIARLPSMVARRSRLVGAAFMPLCIIMLALTRIAGRIGQKELSADVAVLGYHCVARRT